MTDRDKLPVTLTRLEAVTMLLVALTAERTIKVPAHLDAVKSFTDKLWAAIIKAG